MANWVVEALAKEHERDHFSCGQPSLDDYLKKFAKQYAKRKLGTTYVAVATGAKRGSAKRGSAKRPSAAASRYHVFMLSPRAGCRRGVRKGWPYHAVCARGAGSCSKRMKKSLR